MATAPLNADTTGSPQRWTTLHIALHWLVVLLVAAQYFEGESMSALFDANNEGTAVGGATQTLGYLHMAIGIALFAAICARIWDHRTNGRPPHPAGEPNWAAKLAALTQTLLYATLLAMPLAGLAAYFTGSEQIAGLHGLASKVLIALIALHVAGALANHFWFKTDVLRRMMPGQGR